MDIKLDEHQLKAVNHFEGPALVVAGPGSGKTTVIKERILNLIREHNVDPEKILAIAFTRTAAKEMEQRLLPKLNEQYSYVGEPEIRTLHSFGFRIIKRNYEQVNFMKKPSVWKTFELEKTIKEEVYQLKREKANASVTIYIYRIGSKVTDKCYIGQTTDWRRRKEEHLADSSNMNLRQAILAEGRENFTFEVIDEVEGRFADYYETKWIEYYRNLAVFNSDSESEMINIESHNLPVTIYKIENIDSGKCYIGHTTDPKWTEENLLYLPNDALQKAIADEGREQFAFKVIEENVHGTEVIQSIARQIEIYKDRAVFNENYPLSERYSDRLLIELFCEHFNINYEDLLKRPSDIENFAQKIENFEKIANDVEKAKRGITSDIYNANSIDEVVNSIINSIEDLVVRAFADKYERKKRKANAVDFQDMIIYSTYLLRTFPNLHQQILDKYSYVHVDEFQDISPADYQLIKLLPKNLFAVGDDDQAIYGFRGGDSQIMQENFHIEENAKKYEITVNYRSASIIVELSKVLISHNRDFRIPKNLRAFNPTLFPIKVLDTTDETVISTLLREFTEPICRTQDTDKSILISGNNVVEVPLDMYNIGIPVRCRSEVERVRKMLLKIRFKEIKSKRKEGDPCKFIGRSNEESIEVRTIHSMKGKEYDKVILIHNTLGEDFPFEDSENIIEERRVFYVGMTRAKHELVLIGGKCPFVSQLEYDFNFDIERFSKDQIAAIRNGGKCLFMSDWYNFYELELDSLCKRLILTIESRMANSKISFEKIYQTLTQALNTHVSRRINVTNCNTRKKHKLEISSLQSAIKELGNERKKIELTLQQKLISTKESFFGELIAILDQLDLVVNSFNTADIDDKLPTELKTYYDNIKSTQTQFLMILNNHGLKQIGAFGRTLNPKQHEETQSRVFSNEVPKGMIVRELQKGYILNDNIIRKAQVVVSKGEKQSDWYLNFDLTQSLCFVTNDDIYFLQDISIDSEIIRGFDTRGLSVHIQKSEVLFVVTERNWGAVNPIQHEVNSISTRNAISDKYLRALATKKDEYIKNFVIKTGYVLCGRLVSFDNEVINISIDKKIIVIFRHGILAILDDLEFEHTPEEEVPKEEIPIPQVNDSKTQEWGKIMKAYSNGTPVNGEIIKHSKGGLRVRIGSLQGFLPKSQVELRSTQNLDSYVGKTLEMKIIEFNQQQENLVLSRRVLLEEKRRNEFLETVEIGQTVNGVVKNITTFGAFVDIGGIVGLIHKSELTWKPVKHPSEVVAVDDRVEVKIIGINPDEQKISLSMKQTQENLLKDLLEKYPSKP